MDNIQRSFLLAITGVYRTTSTAALQVLLGLPPVFLKFKQEAALTNIIRLRKPVPYDFSPEDFEANITGWKDFSNISLGDGDSQRVLPQIEKNRRTPNQLDNVPGEEVFHIKKCNKCQAFRHLAKDCPRNKPICGNCEGQHQTRKCRSWQVVCINCATHNQMHGTQYDIYHSTSANSFSCYQGEKTNSVAIKIHLDDSPLTVISAYSSPYAEIQQTLQELREVKASIKKEHILLSADLNGHNSLWGYESNDTRGNEILDFILANELFILNNPDSPPTYVRHQSKGWPDLTLCSEAIAKLNPKWEVLDIPTMSDHNYILTTFTSNSLNYRTPPHSPVPDAITVTEPVEWTWDIS
ncbi:hypothetical protein AVEN_229368-1 [Araneus ventricosus]|uniref:Endonuclease/exonuclease/phosphatase domain-containing protein n=1 Tax=Araneus ventricosus TaxID=182803 RepID=A0A4Y2I2F2_ARAVE|nr:hypothetical protein AVEN_229368-1 [Araneus ventricosus]